VSSSSEKSFAGIRRAGRSRLRECRRSSSSSACPARLPWRPRSSASRATAGMPSCRGVALAPTRRLATRRRGALARLTPDEYRSRPGVSPGRCRRSARERVALVAREQFASRARSLELCSPRPSRPADGLSLPRVGQQSPSFDLTGEPALRGPTSWTIVAHPRPSIVSSLCGGALDRPLREFAGFGASDRALPPQPSRPPCRFAPAPCRARSCQDLPSVALSASARSG